MKKQNKDLHPNAIRWMLIAANKIRNRYESAQLIWEAMDGEIPYPLVKLASYFGWELNTRKDWQIRILRKRRKR